jgi:hypothetical protein
MKRCINLSCVLFAVYLLGAQAQQVPECINYQGRLINGTNLVNGILPVTISFFTNAAPVGGETALYVDGGNVDVVDGLYTKELGANPVSGNLRHALTHGAVFLEVNVDGQILEPRQELFSVGYCLVPGQKGNGNEARGTWAAVGGGESNIIHEAASYAMIAGGLLNRIGTNAIGAFIGGGATNQIEKGTHAGVIAGGMGNTIFSGATYSVIGGGLKNRNRAYAGMLGGGACNLVTGTYGVVAGGYYNSATGNWSTVGGGIGNRAVGEDSVIAGGWLNQAVGHESTVGGGVRNIAYGHYSTISGGHTNRAQGRFATVPGGTLNRADGDYSLAAGYQARAEHAGAFVWADSVGGTFSSTDSNLFLVRAQNGMGINTNDPKAALHVAGDAVIGHGTNAPIFGMATVLRQLGDGPGPIFIHPEDNTLMHWDPSTRALTVSNTTAGLVDCTIRLCRQPSTVIWSVDDLLSADALSVSNSLPTTADWYVNVIDENGRAPGFIFHGNGYNDEISGLVIYWKSQ